MQSKVSGEKMIELTNEEKKILSAISFHSEEIESGNLCDTDIKLLEEMREVKKYLGEKYHSFTFEITGCDPKTGTIRDYNEWYYKALEVERDSAFIATSKESGDKYEIEDDFYGETIKQDATKQLEEIMSRYQIPVINIEVSFWEYLGSEYKEGISAKEVLSGKIAAGNDIKIFLDDTRLVDKNYTAVVKNVENALRKEGICGEVYIVVVKDVEGDPVKDRLFSDSFSLDH